MWPFKAAAPWKPKFQIGNHVYVPLSSIGSYVVPGYDSGIMTKGTIGAISSEGWYVVEIQNSKISVVKIHEEFLVLNDAPLNSRTD